MSIFYFNALPKEGLQSEQQNAVRSQVIMARSKEALTPFFQYLETAIKSLRDRGDVQARWKQINKSDLLSLKPMQELCQIPRTTTIRLTGGLPLVYRIEGEFVWDFTIPIMYRLHGERGKINVGQDQKIDDKHIRLFGFPDHCENLNWGGDQIELTLLEGQGFLKEGSTLDFQGRNLPIRKLIDAVTFEVLGDLEDGGTLRIAGGEIDFQTLKKSEPPLGFKVITQNSRNTIGFSPDNKVMGEKVKAWQDYLDEASLVHHQTKRKFEGERTEEGRGIYQVDDIKTWKDAFVVDSNGLRYQLKSAENDTQTRNWIQLEELKEQTEEEDVPGLSPLRAFFEDDVEIVDDKGNVYAIDRGNESEMRLLLYEKKSRPRKRCIPQGEILKAKPNTYQLLCQLNAIKSLQDQPVGQHASLIKLFEEREWVQWQRPKNATPIALRWEVLTDSKRPGADEQQEFVRKALNTPDFAILEGPPGSGKTTVILELICQLVKQGKRILLCGSTHVAIDNVLERLKSQALLQKLSILPIRIGDQNRISDSIKEFQLQKLVEESKVAERLILDASNLVCGTTIGILQHPQIKTANKDWDTRSKTPITPDFDYLIIDECSKTTFHEFLVPAMYAKRWILVGDNKQLSPFTDRNQLTSNIAKLTLKSGDPFTDEHQEACHILYLLRTYLKEKSTGWPLAFVVKPKVLACLFKEIIAAAQIPNPNGKLICAFIATDPAILFKLQNNAKASNKPFCLILPADAESRHVATAADVLFIDEDAYKNQMAYLPLNLVIANRPQWLSSSHAFRVNRYLDQNKVHTTLDFGPRDRGKNTHMEGLTTNISKVFESRTWADEVAWRLEREHQLRLSRGGHKSGRLENDIAQLLPKALTATEELQRRIANIAAVALPSILELLIQGFTRRKNQFPSTLTEGFHREERDDRHLRLSYQQRMHPNISKFPRKQFYNNEALKDVPGFENKRIWDYDKYPDRNVWLNVDGHCSGNYNTMEVDAMAQNLDAFLKFAETNFPPQDSRPDKNVWEVACLTFYRGQEKRLREKLQKTLQSRGNHSNENAHSHSQFRFQMANGPLVSIKLHTVDKFQGQEADIVFLSMVQTHRDGFLDSPNRLNVAITRARYQLVILGRHHYYAQDSRSDDLRAMAMAHPPIPNRR